jgi:hypothetical protein
LDTAAVDPELARSKQLCPEDLRSFTPDRWNLISILTPRVSQMYVSRAHSDHAASVMIRQLASLVDPRPNGIGRRHATPAPSIFCLPRCRHWGSRFSFYHMLRACQQQDTKLGKSALRLRHAGASHWSYLLVKPLNPPIQVLNLIFIQVLTIVQWPIKILRQHVLIK